VTTTPTAARTGKGWVPLRSRAVYHAIGVAVLSAVTLVGGCSADSDTDWKGPTGDRGAGATVTVSRTDIVSVVTVPATVRVSPAVELTAPGPGAVTAFQPHSIDFVQGGHTATVRLPAGLTITRPFVDVGVPVPAHYPIAEARVDGFGLVATADQSVLYRFYSPPRSARGQIKSGVGPFDCPLAHSVPVFADEAAPAPAKAELSIVCIIPNDLNVFAGLPGVMAVTTAEVHDVLTLPVEAVAGSAQRGTVLVEGPDGVVERNVRLGPTDGVRIHVVDGVTEGERVRVPGPDLAGAGR
jgi:hypothetical protein